jgi:alkylation response protein AidB-like acyl-CoA dehydrogenase
VRVGEENQGWTYITQALSQERIGFGVQAAILKHTFHEVMQYARETYHNGKSLYKDPVIRDKLARLAIELEVARLLAARVVWMLEGGVVAYYEASIAKVFVTELEQRLVNAGMQILGLHGQLKKGSKWAPLEGKIEDAYRHSVMATIGGGSTEVQRMIIAIAGLGLPRG